MLFLVRGMVIVISFLVEGGRIVWSVLNDSYELCITALTVVIVPLYGVLCMWIEYTEYAMLCAEL